MQTNTIPPRQGVYVAFQGRKQTRASYNKRRMIRFARLNLGAEVYGMSRDQWKDSGPYGWDGPTFRICGELVYTNRNAAHEKPNATN